MNRRGTGFARVPPGASEFCNRELCPPGALIVVSGEIGTSPTKDPRRNLLSGWLESCEASEERFLRERRPKDYVTLFYTWVPLGVHKPAPQELDSRETSDNSIGLFTGDATFPCTCVPPPVRGLSTCSTCDLVALRRRLGGSGSKSSSSTPPSALSSPSPSSPAITSSPSSSITMSTTRWAAWSRSSSPEAAIAWGLSFQNPESGTVYTRLLRLGHCHPRCLPLPVFPEILLDLQIGPFL